ncbi:MAG TPA: Uma2 family endonuclease [Ktedonobacteraceae bacterium]
MALVSRWDDDEAFSSTFHMSQVEFKERQENSEFGIHEVYEMALEQHPKMSVEDYFALEEKSEDRYEYVDGRVYMMAGGTLNHDIDDVLFEKPISKDKPMYVSGKNMSVEEYDRLEQLDDERYEYINGKAYLMGGCNVEHGQIKRNIELIMDRVLDSGVCRFFGYGVQVLLRNGESERWDYVYPDVTVSCNAADWRPGNTLIEAPRVVVEVLFSRTELKDHREKLQAYLACATIEAYVLVDSWEPYVEMYYKDGKQWRYQCFNAGDEVVLPCLDARFPVDDVYERMAFGEVGERVGEGIE